MTRKEVPVWQVAILVALAGIAVSIWLFTAVSCVKNPSTASGAVNKTTTHSYSFVAKVKTKVGYEKVELRTQSASLCTWFRDLAYRFRKLGHARNVKRCRRIEK